MKIKSKLNPGRLIRRNQIPVEELESGKCQNCDFEFQGHFCPNCGQEVAEFNRPFGFIIYDFVGNFFAFDTRFFRTFKYLLIRPGFLTIEFFRGRRMSYSPPFRIFVFLSFVLFLFLQILTERSLDADISKLNSDEPTKELTAKDSTEVKKVLEERISYEVDSMNLKFIDAKGDTSHIQLNLDDILFSGGNLRSKLNQIATKLEANLSTAKTEKERQRRLSYIAMCRNPEIAVSNVMKYLSWAFFILLPLFALILKLFYLRRKQNYIRHLIFSIHLHSFLFFILIIIVTLRLIFTSNIATVNLVLLISFPVYFVLALRHFYGQNLLKVILKFIGISAIYNIVLWSAVLLVFLKTLNLV